MICGGRGNLGGEVMSLIHLLLVARAKEGGTEGHWFTPRVAEIGGVVG